GTPASYCFRIRARTWGSPRRPRVAGLAARFPFAPFCTRPLQIRDRHLRRRALPHGVNHGVDVGELLLHRRALLLKPGEHLVPIDAAHRPPPLLRSWHLVVSL